jgi:hypothetical protein
VNKPYVFNRNYWPARSPDGRVNRRYRYPDETRDRPWACETDTVSDYFETHAEAIQFALSATREPTA